MTGETKHSESKDYNGAVCPRCHLKSEVSISLHCTYVCSTHYKAVRIKKVTLTMKNMNDFHYVKKAINKHFAVNKGHKRGH